MCLYYTYYTRNQICVRPQTHTNNLTNNHVCARITKTNICIHTCTAKDTHAPSQLCSVQHMPVHVSLFTDDRPHSCCQGEQDTKWGGERRDKPLIWIWMPQVIKNNNNNNRQHNSSCQLLTQILNLLGGSQGRMWHEETSDSAVKVVRAHRRWLTLLHSKLWWGFSIADSDT